MKADCLALVFSAALVLFACATPPSYGPATSARSIGYSDSAIETDRYRVTYRGGDQATACVLQKSAAIQRAFLDQYARAAFAALMYLRTTMDRRCHVK